LVRPKGTCAETAISLRNKNSKHTAGPEESASAETAIVAKKKELQIKCTGSPQTNLEQLLPKQLPGLCHGIPPQNLSMKDPRKNQDALPLVALIEQKVSLTTSKTC